MRKLGVCLVNLLSEERDKKGQVTLFVILAIIVIVSVILLVFFNQDIVTLVSGHVEPKDFIKDCVQEALEPSRKLVLENAGELEPKLTKMYNGSRYNYLCYQSEKNIPCVNVLPMINSVAENSLREDTIDEVENCFEDLKEELEKRKNTVKEGDLTYSIKLVPGSILVNIQKSLVVSKEGSSQLFEDFSFEILSQMYELFEVVRRIVNQETIYCYFDYPNYMMIYPDYKITRMLYRDNFVYDLKTSVSNEKTKFAIRGCTFSKP